MVALVVECAVGDEDVGGRALLLGLALLGAHHDQGQLAGRLPDLLLLDDLLGVRGPVLGALVVAGLRLLDVVDLVAVVVRAAVHVVVLLLALGDGSAREDVEAGLRLGDQVAVLVLLETDVLLLELLLGGLVALVDRLGVDSVEALGGEHLIELFLPLPVDVHLRRTVELATPNRRLLRVLPGIERRVVEVVGVFLAIMRYSLWIFFSSGHSLDLALVPYVVI